MFWILKIVFSKKLREFERKKREQYQIENFSLIDELKKLNYMKSKLEMSTSDDIHKDLFKTLDITKAINNVSSINFIIPYLFISSKDVAELQNFVNDVRKAMQIIISDTRIIEKIDGFYNKEEKDENSIFYKFQNKTVLNQDKFTLS